MNTPVRRMPAGTQSWVEIEAATADDLAIAGRLLTTSYEQRIVSAFADDNAGALGHHVTDLRIGSIVQRPLWDPPAI